MALVEETGAGASADDPEALLNEWLGELTVLTAGLNTTSEASTALRPLEIVAPRIDTYRFSMANLEETQDADLDAILGELCALDSEYDEEISRVSSGYSSTKDQGEAGEPCSQRQESDGSSSIARTDSPDNDSAFSDTVSMLSSESSASSSASSKCKPVKLNIQPNQKEASFQQKADKIKLALERMREANVKKLFIKAFSMDESSKSLLVDEKMTCGYVARLLADKNHVTMEPKWAIVEHLPDLHMERVYEDHEMLVDNLMLWTRESKNKILFSERLDKISLFQTPEKFLLSEDDRGWCGEHDEHSRHLIIEEFFGQSGGVTTTVPSVSGHPVPPIEGPLYLKSEGKKGWKKYNFVLRPSGLYYSPKDKLKSSNELICLATFENNEVYIGLNWKKKYKSPTDYCFAIKHPRLQQPKSVKFIKFLCADDHRTLERWVTAMRIAKHGRQLLENYRSLVEELTQEDLDHLAHARSCSITSIPTKTNGKPAPSITQAQSTSSGASVANSDISNGRHSRASSSSSSGCLSDGGTASESAFDCEYPLGTIKRKPSMKPNIPLTWMTRQMKEMAETQALGAEAGDSGTLTRRPRRLPAREEIYGGSISSESSRCLSGAELPPPPLADTELFGSTLSLESLPPPPPPLDVIEDQCGSQLSLPPPPLDLHPVCASPTLVFPRQPSLDSVSSGASRISDPIYGQQTAYGACLLELQSKKLNGNSSLQKRSSDLPKERSGSIKKVNFADDLQSCADTKKNKKLSFNLKETLPSSPRKPPPPKRNESTRLSSPKKLADSTSNPPKEFLKDLQRVMRKKWQVAQKCKLEPATTPHEVLGFREYPLSESYKEASVSMWVQEHYGGGMEDCFYEPVSGVSAASAGSVGSMGSMGSAGSRARRPPPAPPRRADSTHLTHAPTAPPLHPTA